MYSHKLLATITAVTRESRALNRSPVNFVQFVPDWVVLYLWG